MLKRIFFIIAVLLVVHTGFAQEASQSSVNNTTIWFPNKKNTAKVETRLRVIARCFQRMCNYPMNNLVTDSLNARLDYHVDKEDVSKCLVSDSVCVYVKDSYSWNVENPLPKVGNKELIHLMLKGRAKYTEEEKQLFNYLQFYHGTDKHRIEKYIYYQNYQLDAQLFQVLYRLTFKENGDKDFKLVEIVEK